ncbi:hypothetical protein BDK51DRAFT_40787 [Blyttiomyces helicus]|uniref:Uncharacterized protein n=1 Tax=Blyttiomyces helicus TaxID=388810 RepID=A0A4P9W058_9FUNG|nr:hypothetical protein BDK51DRAFT_40787 [Blyttiomyces helicus]|eukprot:RKO84463.1 hypothetical protein BDK51DRAFT_40787 [Blyttiomyces helicus]
MPSQSSESTPAPDLLPGTIWLANPLSPLHPTHPVPSISQPTRPPPHNNHYHPLQPRHRRSHRRNLPTSPPHPSQRTLLCVGAGAGRARHPPGPPTAVANPPAVAITTHFLVDVYRTIPVRPFLRRKIGEPTPGPAEVEYINIHDAEVDLFGGASGVWRLDPDSLARLIRLCDERIALGRGGGVIGQPVPSVGEGCGSSQGSAGGAGQPSFLVPTSVAGAAETALLIDQHTTMCGEAAAGLLSWPVHSWEGSPTK